MFRVPNLVRLYLSALQMPAQPMMPTLDAFGSRWRHDFATGPAGNPRRGLPTKLTPENRPGIRNQPASR